MKYFNFTDAVDGGLILFGLTISLQDIQSILSIIIIIIDIVWILFKFIIKFFTFIKDGKLDEDEIYQLLDDGKELKEKLDNIQKENKDKEGD